MQGTVHDNCWGKVLGDNCWILIQEFLIVMDAKNIELAAPDFKNSKCSFQNLSKTPTLYGFSTIQLYCIVFSIFQYKDNFGSQGH